MNIAIIPARGGSRRIPRKNVKVFRGKPMLCYPIEVAQASKLFQLIVVSTDDDEIEDTALAMSAIVMRRAKDDGTRGTQDVAKEVLKNIPRADFACVIYPCSPLLSPLDLKAGMMALQGHRYAMSVDEYGADAGCYYWGVGHAFRNDLPLEAEHTAKVQLPRERCLDINSLADWAKAEDMYDALRRAP